MSTHPLLCRGVDNLAPQDLVPTSLTDRLISLIRITRAGFQTSQCPCMYEHAILHRTCSSWKLARSSIFSGHAHSFLYYLLYKQKWLAKVLSLLHSKKFLGDSASIIKPHCSCASRPNIESTAFAVAAEGCAIACRLSLSSPEVL